ncbi:unnamed protein product [[Candida] boidinii]|nr:unnamed protein product [[Candida] boidinii]
MKKVKKSKSADKVVKKSAPKTSKLDIEALKKKLKASESAKKEKEAKSEEEEEEEEELTNAKDESQVDDEGSSASNDTVTFRSLGLKTDILEALDKLNFTKPTPIQVESLPYALAGRDIIGIAQTGSEKHLMLLDQTWVYVVVLLLVVWI